ncbi:hypothetical protein GCM10009779_64370 [Polymorphospora rubra]|uniref:Uncharacterized protein n=1 Tax=Polymorphospora rubra TaxID=338584 RepID=A0A810N0E7_9ACTN|nr:hypothetical protein Prubr_21490 [Polymorphospora rubra]
MTALTAAEAAATLQRLESDAAAKERTANLLAIDLVSREAEASSDGSGSPVAGQGDESLAGLREAHRAAYEAAQAARRQVSGARWLVDLWRQLGCPVNEPSGRLGDAA